jgi:hypothetical protein
VCRKAGGTGHKVLADLGWCQVLPEARGRTEAEAGLAKGREARGRTEAEAGLAKGREACLVDTTAAGARRRWSSISDRS